MIVYGIADSGSEYIYNITFDKGAADEIFDKDYNIIYKTDMSEFDVVDTYIDDEVWTPVDGKVYRPGYYYKVNDKFIDVEEYDGNNEENFPEGYVYDVYENGQIIETKFEEE